jgi:hypothetical protein
MKEKLIELKACKQALEWAGDKTWEEIYNTCHRGDWLLWLFAKTNPDDLQLLTLAKAHCANTVRRLMMDERSTNAVDVAIAFGEGKATIEELNVARTAAEDAATYPARAGFAAYYAANAASHAGFAASYAGYAAYYTYAAEKAASAYHASVATGVASGVATDAALYAEKENQKLTADICRKYLPIKVWNV